MAALGSDRPGKKDISWGALIGVLGLLSILAIVLLPLPFHGPGSGHASTDCIGPMAAVLGAGAAAVVLASALFVRIRRRRGYTPTPRKDSAAAAVVMFLTLVWLWPLACSL